MTDRLKEKLLRVLRRTRALLARPEVFDVSREARDTFSVLLALEGALMFGVTDEMARACAEFCDRMAEQDGLSSHGDTDRP